MASINQDLVNHVKAARAEQAQAEKNLEHFTKLADTQKRIADAGYAALNDDEKAIADGKKEAPPLPKKT